MGFKTALNHHSTHPKHMISNYKIIANSHHAKNPSSPFTNTPFTIHRSHAHVLNSRASRCIIANSTSQSTTSPIFQELTSTGSKINKTSISKYTVAQIREECSILGLDIGGTKPILIQRLLDHYNNNSSDNSDSDNDTTATAAEVASKTPSNSTLSKEPRYTTYNNTTNTNTYNTTPNNTNINITTTNTPVDIHVQWLGTSSGAPTSKRNVSSVAIRYGNDRLFLVDCGEGTHNQLRTANINPALISHIFITHLHGDHCFGIIGALTAIERARARYNNTNNGSNTNGSSSDCYRGRIYIFGPPEIQKMLISAIRSARLQLSIPVTVTGWIFDPEKEMRTKTVDLGDDGMIRFRLQAPDQRNTMPPGYGAEIQSLYDNGSDKIVQQGLTWSVKLQCGLRVTAAQLQHRMPCWGYVFLEPLEYYDIIEDNGSNSNSIGDNGNSSDGSSGIVDVVADESGVATSSTDEDIDTTTNTTNTINTTTTTITSSSSSSTSNRMIRAGRKIVILGDTCNSEAIAPIAMNCDLLSHEATFNKGMEEKAEIATHSTSEQAGAFARRVRAKSLVLTHFSARYEKAEKFKKVWTAARERGISVTELQASVAVGLLEEARAAAAPTRVFLANDYYVYRVPPRGLMLEEQFNANRRTAAANGNAGSVGNGRMMNYNASNGVGGYNNNNTGYNTSYNNNRSGMRSGGGRQQQQQQRVAYSNQRNGDGGYGSGEERGGFNNNRSRQRYGGSE